MHNSFLVLRILFFIKTISDVICCNTLLQIYVPGICPPKTSCYMSQAIPCLCCKLLKLALLLCQFLLTLDPSVFLAVAAYERHLSGLCDCLQQLACLHWHVCVVSRDDLVWQLRMNSARKLITLQDVNIQTGKR